MMIRRASAPFLRIGLVVMAALPLAGCGAGDSVNRGVQSVHQPVVSHSVFVYDVRLGTGSRLSPDERARMIGWLDSLHVGYGDHVAVATQDSYLPSALRDDIADVLGQRGMLVEEDSTASAGRPPAGSVRLVLRRASAQVPGCPDWTGKQESDLINGVSSNFGCATNSNIAAMVADPDDLVRGQSADSALRTATSDKAIQTYRDKTPTGSGSLMNVGGGN